MECVSSTQTNTYRTDTIVYESWGQMLTGPTIHLYAR